jgi:hypothetical protein
VQFSNVVIEEGLEQCTWFFGDNQDQQLRFGERVLRRASPDFNDGINRQASSNHDSFSRQRKLLLVGKSGGRG